MVMQMKGMSSVIAYYSLREKKASWELSPPPGNCLLGSVQERMAAEPLQGEFSPWNARLPLGLREDKWEQKGTEQVSATAPGHAVFWLPITDLRPDLIL